MKEIRTIKEEPKMSARVIKDEKKDKDEDEEGDISEKTDPYLHDVLSYSNFLFLNLFSFLIFSV